MRKTWVRAARDSEVREAARAWRRVGAIDEPGLARVEELFGTPWPNPTLVWEVLAFVFVSFAVIGLFAAIAIASGGHSIASVAFLFAALLAMAAESLRGSASGPASASGATAAFWSVTCLLVGTADASGWGHVSATLVLGVGAASWAAAAWHWGYPTFAVFSSAFFFLFLARMEHGRALWLVLGSTLAAACVPLLDWPRLAPPHRRSAAAALAVCLCAVYVAVNPYSLERGSVELIASLPAVSPSPFLHIAAASAIALFPLFLLVWGIRSRRALLLGLGIVFAALSLATLRYYVHIAPLWAILSAAGAVLIGLALVLHRWLDRAPGRERRGFTADALFEDENKQQALGTVAAALTLSPEARSAPKAEPGAFQGGGGGSGGGGASNSF